MGLNQFIADFKEMVKTKDMKNFNEKYTKPGLRQLEKGAIAAKDCIVKYTPVVVEAGKKGFEKANIVFKQQMDKRKASSTNNTSGQASPTITPTDTSSTPSSTSSHTGSTPSSTSSHTNSSTERKDK